MCTVDKQASFPTGLVRVFCRSLPSKTRHSFCSTFHSLIRMPNVPASFLRRVLFTRASPRDATRRSLPVFCIAISSCLCFSKAMSCASEAQEGRSPNKTNERAKSIGNTEGSERTRAVALDERTVNVNNHKCSSIARTYPPHLLLEDLVSDARRHLAVSREGNLRKASRLSPANALRRGFGALLADSL